MRIHAYDWEKLLSPKGAVFCHSVSYRDRPVFVTSTTLDTASAQFLIPWVRQARVSDVPRFDTAQVVTEQYKLLSSGVCTRYGPVILAKYERACHDCDSLLGTCHEIRNTSLLVRVGCWD
jgi:hypothetical protein